MVFLLTLGWLAGCGLADIPGLVARQSTLFVSAISPPWGKNERLGQIAVNCRARKTEKRTSLVFEYMVSTLCSKRTHARGVVGGILKAAFLQSKLQTGQTRLKQCK